jgi:hypothetical protein
MDGFDRSRRGMASGVNCYEDKRASLILLADKPYGICNCKPNNHQLHLSDDCSHLLTINMISKIDHIKSLALSFVRDLLQKNNSDHDHWQQHLPPQCHKSRAQPFGT